MKKFLLGFLMLAIFTPVVFAPVASAQSILPSTPLNDEECHDVLAENVFLKDLFKNGKSFPIHDENGKEIQVKYDDALACAFRSGQIKLWMLPLYVLYLIEFLTVLAGILSVGFIVVGGYHFIIGGIFEEKEKGKKTIKNALIGFVLSMLAYTIVNLVQIAVTS